ncbi:hypothetical protein [Streptococcus ruminantium]|uniref:hypothetical protein n=1 Tax=Streptococcus ruminantium TaxID=1917441 RepID=UPI0012DDFC06|nr:hypothetical protein [Streptococcus ruminantium]
MKFLRDLKNDYYKSRFSLHEGFTEWFLKRKLGFWGKIAFAYFLWSIWLLLFTHPHYAVFFFYGVLIVSLVVIVLEWLNNRKQR